MKILKWMTETLLVLAIFSASAFAQEEEETELNIKNKISLFLGYTYIPEAGNLDATKEEGLFVPSIGLDYFHRVAPKWEVGIMMDVELGHYLIIPKELERENAFIATFLGLYKLAPHLSLFGGGGVEFEKHENLAVFRIGAEGPINLGSEWILAPVSNLILKQAITPGHWVLRLEKSFEKYRMIS